ncbi:MAG: DegT/DnrJ/EryC1/StrS family aminotransferase [Polyangia bacterium]
MRVPLIDLSAQYNALKPALDAAVARVLTSGRYVMGPELTAFEQELGAYLGGLHVVAVSSGTDALLSAAMALEIGLGTGARFGCTPAPAAFDAEVVTTAFSFFATPETAVRLGARPVFCDIEEESLNADVDDMLGRVTPRTQAFLPVHLFGRRMELSRLIATGLPVLEDAAQTLVPGIAKDTACATLSFFPTKNLGAAGDGGAVVTRDAQLADKLGVMRQHGSRPKYVHSLWGGNFRMDPIQAAILRVKLQHLDSWNAARRSNAARYRERLADLPLRLPTDEPGHVYHHFVVRAPRRDALRAFLSERNIETEVYYPVPLHLMPCFAQFGYKSGDCPRSERAAAEVLALPVHPDLSADQIDFVAEQVRAFYKG